MSGGEFAAIEARANAATYARTEAAAATRAGIRVGDWARKTADSSAIDVPALLAAVRERDNTIARVRAVLDDYDGLDAEPIPKLSTYTWMHEVRAALDPQETE